MSRILIINPILYTSETNRIPRVQSIKDTMIYTLCLGFLKKGQQVTLIAARDYRPEKEEAYDFPVVFMDTVMHRVFQPRCFPYMPGLRGFLRKHTEYDYIISSEMFATWSYTVARVCPDKAVVWHELAKHNNMLRQMPSKVWYNLVARFLMRRVTVIPRSKAAADFIRHFTCNVSDTVIDHGVETEKIAAMQAPQRNSQFVAVSQLIGRKRIDRTIDSFAKFWNKGHREYKLYIIGRGELEAELKAQVKRLRMEESIIFCGQLTHDKLLPLVAQSQALLVSTEKDNNMVSVAESIAAGTPVVTTPVPYNAYYIEKEKLGIVKENWGEETLEEICADYAVYAQNCVRYREKLSNVYCAGQFMKVMASK